MNESCKRWRLILNGKSAGDDPLRDAVAAMRGCGTALSVRVTWEGGDAERYVDEAIGDGVDTIVAAGGDGTLSEVAATLGALVTEGKHVALDRVATRVQLPWVEIDATQPLVLNLDGEPVESGHFRIDCVPARVRMHLPPGCALLSAMPA